MERNEGGWAYKAGYLTASVNLVILLRSEDLHPASVCTCGLLGRVTKVMHKFLYKTGYCEQKFSNMCSNLSIKFFPLQVVLTFYNIFIYSVSQPNQTIRHFLKIFVTFIFYAISSISNVSFHSFYQNYAYPP